ncbi:glycosyl hydrolase family 8 [Halomonas sp. CUBES01]|uniref:cellulase n=1 Tax=Vreelandella gomseomensis TaxID=370766 RepID=A0ABU1GES6_9GAMM|nr:MULTISPECIES: glycosyl hydrolase family 8 [Halomonas]MDR5875988.1 glycosyl hydrolase family 8 [Halomonas gomseomensis]MEC4766683.1 glycosyl hydrolase family 8 [Halomonas sp. CUBES01]
MKMIPLSAMTVLASLMVGSGINTANAEETSMDDAWSAYVSRFVAEEGRVIDTGNNNISHSEGQGWGMMLAQHYGDQRTFKQLWRWTRRELGRQDVSLFSWRYDPNETPPVRDNNNAADGDLFIAWALHLAGQRWENRNYTNASNSIRRAIADELVVDLADYTVLLPGLEGFKHSDNVDINLSYWFVPAMQDFADIAPEEPWEALINDGVKLLDETTFGQYRLPTDWVTLTDDGAVSPADEWEPRFSFDAVRIPLYFAWGQRDEAASIGSIMAFWNDPSNQPASAWIDVQSDERADYPISRGVKAIRAYVNNETLPDPVPTEDDDYFSATLLLLAHMANDMQ